MYFLWVIIFSMVIEYPDIVYDLEYIFFIYVVFFIDEIDTFETQTQIVFTPLLLFLKTQLNLIILVINTLYFNFTNTVKRLSGLLIWKPLFKKNSYFGLFRNNKNNKFINTIFKK